MTPTDHLRVLGMISGTSHDGIDTAVVDFSVEDDVLHGRLGHRGSTPYSPGLRAALVRALPPEPVTAQDLCELDVRIGQEFAAAAVAALADGDADLVCSHGQTLFHWVDGPRVRGTLQVGQPAWTAEATGLPVVSDVRTADVAAGGQGAPLVPLLDVLLLAPLVAEGRRVAALNLGGISNLTVCAPDGDPVAWDVGPANALVDAVVSAASSLSYDEGGRLAAAGTVDEPLLESLLTEPYYALPAPKSCGKELFSGRYVEQHLTRLGHRPELPDLVATLVALTARTVADAVRSAGVDAVYAAGGGMNNPALVQAVSTELGEVPLRGVDDLGCPADEKEAVAFALIGWATAHGLPGNVPSCTGASGPRVLGRVTPGRSRSAWEPLARMPSRLVLS